MSTITNTYDLPAPLVAAIRNDEYSRGDCDLSVTELIGPARIRQLKRKYDKLITEDASDRLWSLIGKIGHKILEHGAGGSSPKLEHARTILSRALVLAEQDGPMREMLNEAYDALDSAIPERADGDLVEHRFFMERGGYRISGQVDYLPAGREICDYKFTSYHTAKSGPKPEWVQQLNVYRLLAHVNDVPVDRLRIVAIYRDWSKMAASRSREDYPQAQVGVFTLPLWSHEKAEQFVTARVHAHQQAETQLPECTDEERWAKPPRFALMQKGKKRAIKLYDTLEEAERAVSVENKQYVEDRPGEWTRCEHYCVCAPHCSQFRDYLAEKHS